MSHYNHTKPGEIIYPQAPEKTKVDIPSSSFFGVLLDKSAYKSMIYVLIFFGISIATFVYTITMLSLSIGLAITIFGLPVAYIFLRSIPVMVQIQAEFATLLLDVPQPTYSQLQLEGGFLERLLQLVDNSKIQLGIISSIILFPAAIAAFVIAVTGGSVSFAFIATVFYPLVRTILLNSGVAINDDVVFMNAGIPEWIAIPIVMVVGILLLAFTLHFAKIVAYTHTKLLVHLSEMRA